MKRFHSRQTLFHSRQKEFHSQTFVVINRPSPRKRTEHRMRTSKRTSIFQFSEGLVAVNLGVKHRTWTASPLKYWRQWRWWSPQPPAFAACERRSRRRRARLTSSATSSRSSRRRRRRQRRSLRRSEVAPVVCESLGLHLSVRSGRGCRSPVWSPRSGVVYASWASGFPYSPKEDHGRLVSSSRL